MEFTKLKDIDASKVDTIRGNTGYTSVYTEDGLVFYVSEEFETAQKHFEP